MTQEDKLLLIRDLSARLPYAVTIECTSGFRGTLHDIKVHHIYDDNDNVCDAICYTDYFGDGDLIRIEEFKPYLRPMSSMTEEQEMEYLNTCVSKNPLYWTTDTFEWLNKNHFDYNYLIDGDLAIDATGLNIY